MEREWTYRTDASPVEGAADFSLMCWNILAESLVDHEYIPYASPEDVAWEARGPQLVGVFKERAPDILCLQEVDAHHHDYFSEQLGGLGYAGSFKKRTGDKGRTDSEMPLIGGAAHTALVLHQSTGAQPSGGQVRSQKWGKRAAWNSICVWRIWIAIMSRS
jgi:mRNA deadenylase 3'-5' endonuclease subunit Ccr4